MPTDPTSRTVLVIGGAGFIGSYVVLDLLRHGYAVRVLDSLDFQVHPSGKTPDWLRQSDCEFVMGDVTDADCVAEALRDASYVVHLAARVGVGQSMYEASDYVRTNSLGTAVLMEAVTERSRQGAGLRRVVVASSMSIYGEGAHATGGSEQQLGRQSDDGSVSPVPTPESFPSRPASIYALTKYDQEQTVLLMGAAAGVETVALRLFNVYGAGQVLSNPYTGVIAIFASQLLSGGTPRIYEDGQQLRDFVHASDVAKAFRLVLDAEAVPEPIYNVGSGVARTILSVAQDLANALGRPTPPNVTGKRRSGDVRHCFADVSAIRRDLGYEPETTWADGLASLGRWLATAHATDHTERADKELSVRGLLS